MLENVDINLGKACNNRCLFCSNGDATAEERRWSKAEDVAAEIRARAREGYTSIGLLGGEPTIYPKLVELVAEAKAQGFSRIAIISNGSRLADRDHLDRLLEAGMTRVALSIHSHRAGIEDAITDRPGSFAEKLAALDLLVAAERAGKLPDGCSLNTVLHARILGELEDFCAFMHQRDVRDIRFNFIRPCHRAEGSRRWVPSLKDTTPAVRRLVLRNESALHMSINFADLPLCKLPWEIMSNQTLRGRYLGELRDLSTDVTEMRRRASRTAPEGKLRFAWKEKRMQFKTWLAGCDACALRASCEGIWTGYLSIYGEAEFRAGPALVRAFGVTR